MECMFILINSSSLNYLQGFLKQIETLGAKTALAGKYGTKLKLRIGILDIDINIIFLIYAIIAYTCFA